MSQNNYDRRHVALHPETYEHLMTLVSHLQEEKTYSKVTIGEAVHSAVDFALKFLPLKRRLRQNERYKQVTIAEAVHHAVEAALKKHKPKAKADPETL